MDKEKLSALVVRAKDGDEEAMNDIYSATSDMISYFCEKTLAAADPGAAVTEIYKFVEKNIGALDDAANFMQWLKMLSVQYCIKKLGASLGEEAWSSDNDDRLPDIPEVNPDDIVGQLVYAPQIKSAVPVMMADMHAPERICAYSYYFFGMSPSQISQLAGVPESTVASKLKAVRFGIKTNMKFYSGLNDEDADDLVFSRQMIRDYLYSDLEKITAKKKVDAAAVAPVPKVYRAGEGKHTETPKPPQIPQEAPEKIKRRIRPKNDEEELIRRSENVGHEASKQGDDRKSKVLMIIIVIVAALALIAGCVYAAITIKSIGSGRETTGTDAEITLKSLALDKLQIDVELGGTYTLVPVFTPSDTTNKSLLWQSQDESIATVDENGVIKGISAGKTYVRAISKAYLDYSENPDGEAIAAYCEVTVKCTPELLEITEESVTLEPGETVTLGSRIYPTAAASLVTWSSYDETVAKVDQNGKVTAINEGVTVISLIYDESHIAVCTVIVAYKQIAATNVTVDKTTLSLVPGQSEKLTATVYPSNSTDKLTWLSTDTKIATVDENGTVTAVSGGTVEIVAYCGTCIASCEVTVSTPVTSISLTQSSFDVTVGDVVYLIEYVNVLPSTATDKTVVFEIISGKELLISVDDSNSYICPLYAGVIVVTVKSVNNPSATCTFVITAKAKATT